MKIMKDKKAEMVPSEEDKMEDSESRRRQQTLRSLLTPSLPTAAALAADPVSASFAELMGVDEDYYYDGTQYFYDDDELKNVQLEAVNGAIGQAKANDKDKDHRTRGRASSRFSRLQQQQHRRGNFNHRRLGGTGATGGVGATGLSGIEYTNPADALSGGITGLSGGPTGIGSTGLGGMGGTGGADAIGSRRMRNRRRDNNNNNGVRRSGGFAGGYGSGYGGSGYGGGGGIERSSGYGGGGHSGGGYGHSGGSGGGHPIVILKKKKTKDQDGVLDDILGDLFGDTDTFLLLFGAALVAAATAVGIFAFMNQGRRRRRKRSLADPEGEVDDDDEGGDWQTLQDKIFAAVSKGRREKVFLSSLAADAIAFCSMILYWPCGEYGHCNCNLVQSIPELLARNFGNVAWFLYLAT